MYNLSPQEEEDRWSRVNRLYLAEAGKKECRHWVQQKLAVN